MSFSGFPTGGFFGITGAALGDLGPGLIKAKRDIQGLVADVTVEEHHEDRLTITQHPVEKTAAITDHAYKEPPTVTIHCGWSASSPQAGGDVDYPKAIYDTLLGFQDNVELLVIYTGKRRYEDMLLVEIEIVTDQDAEFALVASLTFQHVNLVETTTVSVPPNSTQKTPESTGSQVNRGPQNLKPTSPTPTTITGDPIDQIYLQ